MSNNMCSLENGSIGSTKHSMPAIVSTCSPSFTCSPLTSKPFGSHLFGSMSSLPLPPPSSHTAFPFPPNPLFLSSLNLFNAQSSMSWFSAHNSLNTPLSLTTNDSKDMTSASNDNNNNKMDIKYKDSTQAMINPNKNNLSEKIKTDSTARTSPANADHSIGSNNVSMNESERNTTRSHSDNLNWLAEVAISSRGLPPVPSSPSGSAHLALPLTHQPPHPTHPSQRIYHPSLGNDMASGQRLYSPRFGSSSPTYLSYGTPNSPIGPLNMNGVRTAPTSAHFSGPYVSNFNAYQQFSPTTAQNAISSPFLVPNQLSVANTRSQTYSTGIMESYHQNSQNGHNSSHILSSNSSSIASQALNANTSRSPSLHSSDSSSMISSGPFSSPTISSESAEPQTKSMMRSIKDSIIDSHNDMSARSGANDMKNSLILSGIKRKSPSSPELNNDEKNLYKLPFGKEGSRKHRILKPPNISIVDPNKSGATGLLSAPLSAPPIPGVRRQEFLKRMSNSDIECYSNESIADPKNCHNIHTIASFGHQRRKSVPLTMSSLSSHKPFPTFAAKENSIDNSSHFLVPNENCLPTEEHNRLHNHLQYPVYFQKGSIIQLGNGNVKRVEEMSTQDFIDSATGSPDLCADCSEVLKIEEKIKSCSALLSFSVGRTKVPVTVEAPVEHPFFVFHKGWSSCSPERSHQRYGLKCRKLKVGDNCVSLTPRPTPNCSQTTTKSNKSVTKSSIVDQSNRTKPKSILSNHNIRSGSQTPLSLVKCSAGATNASERSSAEALPDCQRVEAKPKPNELLVNTVLSDVSKVPEMSDLSDVSNISDNISDSVPMSSSNAETVKALNRNRRHSAPDAIESEPSKAS